MLEVKALQLLVSLSMQAQSSRAAAAALLLPVAALVLREALFTGFTVSAPSDASPPQTLSTANAQAADALDGPAMATLLLIPRLPKLVSVPETTIPLPLDLLQLNILLDDTANALPVVPVTVALDENLASAKLLEATTTMSRENAMIAELRSVSPRKSLEWRNVTPRWTLLYLMVLDLL